MSPTILLPLFALVPLPHRWWAVPVPITRHTLIDSPMQPASLTSRVCHSVTCSLPGQLINNPIWFIYHRRSCCVIIRLRVKNVAAHKGCHKLMSSSGWWSHFPLYVACSSLMFSLLVCPSPEYQVHCPVGEVGFNQWEKGQQSVCIIQTMLCHIGMCVKFCLLLLWITLSDMHLVM